MGYFTACKEKGGGKFCLHHFKFATTTNITLMNREIRKISGGVEAGMQNSWVLLHFWW